ncbi:MAG TPA: LamG domain-containing protein, partial [Verrucomicrobiae bacterium]|nr:LamG domain-containing protein [Verrucomicrobiae bacterium]
MKQQKYLPFVLALSLTPAVAQAADVRLGLVSYWPLNELSADQATTPDVVGGNHFTVIGLDPSYVVPGKRGNALSFNGVDQYAFYIDPPERDSGLPIAQGHRYSVAFWVKGAGAGQSDRRMFSESSSLTTDPLVNLGTHNAGTDGTVDVFIRNSGAQINHAHSPGTALDDAWHHIAWTDDAGNGSLYLDGVLNTNFVYAPGPTAYDTTSIGAIVRGGGDNVGAFFAGLIDDVAVWERVLSPAEVQEVATTGL